MQTTLLVVFAAAACLGGSTAEVECSDYCLKLAREYNEAADRWTREVIYDRLYKAGCDEECIQYQLTLTEPPPEWWYRSSAASASREPAEHHSRLAAPHHSRVTTRGATSSAA